MQHCSKWVLDHDFAWLCMTLPTGGGWKQALQQHPIHNGNIWALLVHDLRGSVSKITAARHCQALSIAWASTTATGGKSNLVTPIFSRQTAWFWWTSRYWELFPSISIDTCHHHGVSGSSFTPKNQLVWGLLYGLATMAHTNRPPWGCCRKVHLPLAFGSSSPVIEIGGMTDVGPQTEEYWGILRVWSGIKFEHQTSGHLAKLYDHSLTWNVGPLMFPSGPWRHEPVLKCGAFGGWFPRIQPPWFCENPVLQ